MYETSYRFHFTDLWLDKEELEKYIAEQCSVDTIFTSLNTPEHKWFIAETDAINSNVIGFSKIITNQTIPDENIIGLYLHKLYLIPHLTGKNYGEQLFDHVVTLGQEWGQKWLWLEVLEKNKYAIKFYAKKGMTWQKDILFSSSKQQSTLHIMTKKLLN
ncbi:GNAT family acetyltransferase [Xenorhabdus mauleonii]|uniref:Acetyltransferase (GNAT) family protein n=1 Tax=Xenorhabdus mauleonii TaxID=351675 RepID=A0A1I3PDZ3_9GAMM|nr:GNAT family N-acetyltransferase [Xenorhabdus mauleonii]PHM44837.1 GNAT family acetyltransferase [Xenorhabdus mauleonii]SFJ19599.1 Acetyltransferase (GNAT) family protein [Xenorhabdus mauleonii]